MIYKRKALFTALAGLLLALVVLDIGLGIWNQSLRMEVGQRQQMISQSIQLEALHREIVTAVATVAVKTNDEQLKSLLASQGIGLKPDSGQAGGAK